MKFASNTYQSGQNRKSRRQDGAAQRLQQQCRGFPIHWTEDQQDLKLETLLTEFKAHRKSGAISHENKHAAAVNVLQPFAVQLGILRHQAWIKKFIN